MLVKLQETQSPGASILIRSAVLFALFLPGCASRITQFPQLSPSRVWPPVPDKPRIRYVGEIIGPQSLGIRSGSSNLLKDIIAGAAAPIRLITPMAVTANDTMIAIADSGAQPAPAVYVFNRVARTMKQFENVAGAPLREPLDVAILENNQLAIADARRAEVLLCDITTGASRAMAAGFGRPVGLAWDGTARQLWVADADRHECVAISLAGEITDRLGGCDTLSFPVGIGVRNRSGTSRTAVADAMNFRAAIFSGANRLVATVGQKGDGAGDFSLPRDVAFDSAGRLYVLDNQFENVQIFDQDYRLLMAFGEGGAAAGEFNLPSGIFIDENNWIWIADSRNHRVQVFELLEDADK